MLGSSPWLIAACNVLHRLPAPRHPPGALCNLPRRCSRSLWSSQGSRCGSAPAPSRMTTPGPRAGGVTAWFTAGPAPAAARGGNRRDEGALPHPSKLHSVPDTPHAIHVQVMTARGGLPQGVAACADRIASDPRSWTATTAAGRLLRKEVIQPHLPVRLPCYDFVPIASPTFDGSLHKGWATGFGCYRLS